MYTLLISLGGLFFSGHGLSLSSGQSSPEPSQNDELWESINQVVDSIKPMAIHAERRLSLDEKPRRRRRGKDRTMAPDGAPASGATMVPDGAPASVARATVGTQVNGTRAANSSAGAAGGAAEAHILLGAHHKCGTRLLESIELNLVVHMHVPKQKVSACPHFTSVGAGPVVRPCQLNMRTYKEFRALPGVKRVLHLTRDPLKLVLAGYLYHRESQDGIFSEKVSPKKLAKMPIKSGLEEFAKFAISSWLKDMVNVHTAIKAGGVDALTVQLEDFIGSEAMFNVASEKVYQFLSGGDGRVAKDMLASATKFKLFNRTKEFVKANETLRDLTQNAYRQMSQLPRNVLGHLMDMRYKLDYNVD